MPVETMSLRDACRYLVIDRSLTPPAAAEVVERAKQRFLQEEADFDGNKARNAALRTDNTRLEAANAAASEQLQAKGRSLDERDAQLREQDARLWALQATIAEREAHLREIDELGPLFSRVATLLGG